jgi:superfamily II DNA helicase RecQ
VNDNAVKATLKKYFGFDELRDGQIEVLRAALSGKDTAIFWPTGAGKSLCYQLPGTLFTLLLRLRGNGSTWSSSYSIECACQRHMHL